MEDGPNIAFFGTSEFSVMILENMLKEGIIPSLIVTAPDTKSGRNLVLSPPPVKVWALNNQIKMIQPESLKEIPKEIVDQFWDLFIVVSYGRILPKNILDIPDRGTLNVHPSLLPKLRGASPIQSAILNDTRETGVTVMLLDEKMDHGPIVAQASTEIKDWPPSFSVLEQLLSDVGGELLTETILPWINGDIKEEPQNHSEATYVEKIKKEDGLINFDDDPYQNFLKIQAFSNWPGTYFFVEKNGKKIRVKISEASYSNGTLKLKRVIPEGRKEMDYSDFKRGLS